MNNSNALAIGHIAVSTINLMGEPVMFLDPNNSVKLTIEAKPYSPAVADEEMIGGFVNLEGIDIEHFIKYYKLDAYPVPSQPSPNVFYLVPWHLAAEIKTTGRDVSDLLIPSNKVLDDNGRLLGYRSVDTLG